MASVLDFIGSHLPQVDPRQAMQKLLGNLDNTPLVSPEARNSSKAIGDPNQMKLTVTSSLGKGSPPPAVANPVQVQAQPAAAGRFNYGRFGRDSAFPATIGRNPNWQPPQPPAQVADLIASVFGDRADLAALIAANENASFDPRVKDNINANGSPDRGLFQINQDTFNGLMQRRGQELRKLGINSFEDMYDPMKNTQVGKMILDEGGPGRWFGWQDNGYDLNEGYYSAPRRIDYETKKRGGKVKTKP